MRLDHIAYRVEDRKAFAAQLKRMFDFSEAATFQPYGDDSVECITLVPPERSGSFLNLPLIAGSYHAPAEIFVSDGKPGSVVANWVKENGPGVHHIAYQVANVTEQMEAWQRVGVRFLSDRPLKCPGITQVFTEPQPMFGGMIIELIQRTSNRGFCGDNVRALMESTRGLES